MFIRKITLVVFVYMIATASSTSFQTTSKNDLLTKSSPPEQPNAAVKRTLDFLLAVESKNFNKLEPFFTSAPRSYIERMYPNKDDRTQKPTPPGKPTARGESNSLVTSETEFDRNFVLGRFPSFFNENQIYLDEVENSTLLEDDARVRIRFRSRLSQTYSSEFDFFLHKDADEWKIFNISWARPSESFPK